MKSIFIYIYGIIFKLLYMGKISISSNEARFFLILMDKGTDFRKLSTLFHQEELQTSQACYVCLRQSYKEIMTAMEKNSIPPQLFLFVDAVTSGKELRDPEEDCIFLPSDMTLDQLQNSLSSILERFHCPIILFDAACTLLARQEISAIVKFTHSLISKQEETQTLFVMEKNCGQGRAEGTLIKDLELFADEVLDFSSGGEHGNDCHC